LARTFKLICFYFYFTTLTYAGNTGAGSAPVSPAQSQYNSKWSTYHQPPKAPQKKHGVPSNTVSISSEYIDQNGERWTVFQGADGSYWGVNSQEKFRRFNQDPMQN